MQNSFSLFFNHYVAHFPFLNRSPHFSTNKSEDHQRGCDWSTVPKKKGVSHWSTMRKGNASGSNLPYFLASKVLARKYNQTKIGYYVVPRTRTISPFKHRLQEARDCLTRRWRNAGKNQTPGFQSYIRDKPYSRRKSINWDSYTFIPTNENGELAVKTEICWCQPIKLKNHRGKSIKKKDRRNFHRKVRNKVTISA